MKKRAITLIIGLILLISFGFVIGEFSSDFSGNREINLLRGWNLVTIYAVKDLLEADPDPQISILQEKGIKAVYYYDPYNKEYIRFLPNQESDKLERLAKKIGDVEQGGSVDNYIRYVNSPVWIYSEKETTLDYVFFDGPAPIDKLKLLSGWNFIIVTPDMIGKTINEIKGDCNILRAHPFDIATQEWDDDMVTSNWKFEENTIIETGRGIVIKVSSGCQLGTSGSTTSPPGLPGEGVEGCSDTDRGVDLYIKGTMSVEINGETVTASDNCAYDNAPDDPNGVRYIQNMSCSAGDDCYIQELNCGGYEDSPPGDYSESFNCPNGCQDGACIQ